MESLDESSAEQNAAAVERFYVAVKRGDTDAVSGLLAADLDWWFHGPPRCQHMMRLLTGETTCRDFQFEPRGITAIGERVVAEGWEGAHVYWVHVWTVQDGVITQFREYFNTWLTVRGLSLPQWQTRQRGSTLWQSGLREHPDRSFPELLLAI